MTTRKLEERKAWALKISRNGIYHIRELLTGRYLDCIQGQTQANSVPFGTRTRNNLLRAKHCVIKLSQELYKVVLLSLCTDEGTEAKKSYVTVWDPQLVSG